MHSFTVSHTIHIAAPPQAAWRLVSDTSRYAEWIINTLAVTEHCGTTHLGGIYRERNRILGPITGTSSWTVVHLDEKTGEQTHVSRDLPMGETTVLIHVEPEGAGTRYTQGIRIDVDLGVLSGVIARILRGSLDRNNRDSVIAFGALVEREHRAVSPTA